jgi:murein DD-endopeptidase MepM/ murein hydrolase activator NlpD
MVGFKHIIRKRINYRRLYIYIASAVILAAGFDFAFSYYPAAFASAETAADASSSPQNLKLKDRLYEIEAMINKKQNEIEQAKEEIETNKSGRRIKDEEYQSARKRLDENEKKGRELYEQKIKLSKTLKLNTDNLLRKKTLLNDRIRAAYKNSFRKKMGYVIKSDSFVDFYVNLNYLTRIIKFDTGFISDISKKVADIKKQREILGYKIKELEIINRDSREFEKSLKSSSVKMGGRISALYDREVSLKQELSVLFLEKERIEKQIVTEAPQDIKPAPATSFGHEDPGGSSTANLTAGETQETAGVKTPLEGGIKNTEKEAAVDISSLALMWPLKDSKSVLSFYGTQKDPKYNVNYFNSGIDITGGYNEEVIAAADGQIKYKGEMKSVGKLLILDHGGNITTLYSHLGIIEVGMGQKVKRGEVIGRLKEKSAAETARPFLHFEIRINGNTKDPMDYL